MDGKNMASEIVKERARITIRCKLKPFDQLPAHYLCCQQKIDLLKKICEVDVVRTAYVGAKPMIGYCRFCSKKLPETMILLETTSTNLVQHALPVDQYDIDEGFIE